MKKLITATMVAALSVGAFATTASATEGNAYGHGCKLANNSTYDTPADMLKYLAGRDGSFQNTLVLYPQFTSVGDLISKKCGPANL